MKMKPFVLGIFLLAAVLAVYFGWSTTPRQGETTGNVSVVTSFYPLYYFASQIGGQRISIYNLTPAGAEPHDYEPTTQDMARIEDAKLLILNGGKFEAWGERVREALRGTKVTVADVGETLINKKIREGGVTVNDPHVWLSPALAKKEVAAIAEALKQVDPANVSFYETNTKELEAKLDTLDQDFQNGLRRCAGTQVVTSHAAFGYMTADYGLTQVAISGLSPDAEPTAQKLAEVADFVRRNNITYIFFESLVSPRLAETIARETGAKTLPLNPLEGLTDEEMSRGEDYFTVMRGNLKNLRLALRCE